MPKLTVELIVCIVLVIVFAIASYVFFMHRSFSGAFICAVAVGAFSYVLIQEFTEPEE